MHGTRRRRPDASPDDGRIRPRAAARGDHPRRAAGGHAAAAGRARPLARDEHLADPGGGPAAGGARPGEACAPPGRTGAGLRPGRAARPVRGAARARVARRPARRGAVDERRGRRCARAPRLARRVARRGRRAEHDARPHRLPLHPLRRLTVTVAGQPDPARVGPLGAVPAGALLPGRRPAEAPPGTGRAAARRVHRPRLARRRPGALRAPELASLFFETELGGKGIFAR